MPRSTPTEDLKLIESIVSAHPNGIGISAIETEIAQRTGARSNRRTLQRRLQKLIKDQRLTTEGESIALVYKPISGVAVHLEGAAASASTGRAEIELYVPLSTEAAFIRDHVSRPLMHRRPVGYPKDFEQISSLLALHLPDFRLLTLMQAAASLGLDDHDNSEADPVPIARAPSDSKQSKVPLSRFGLGTAQFGMHYGRFNRDGVPSRETASAVLQSAASRGLSCIDTAHLYGEAESVLGSCHRALKPFSVITKTPRFADDRIYASDAQRLREAFIGSLQLMHQSSIEGLLVHHAPNLLSPGGQWLYEEMCALKQQGLVRKIGVSAYTGEVAEAVLEKFALDIVQLPVNVLDNRLIRGGALKRIASAGVEIHARSAFLQGLLLADPDTLSQHFDPAKPVLKAFHTAARQAQVSPAHAALHYLIGIKEIDKIIVGVEWRQPE